MIYMEYIVFECPCINNLEDKINEHLNKGYILQGGIATSVDAYQNYFYCQAMIRIKNPEEEQV